MKVRNIIERDWESDSDCDSECDWDSDSDSDSDKKRIEIGKIKERIGMKE